MKKTKFHNLILLYLNYCFQKTTIIVFAFSLILLIISLVGMSSINYSHESYLLNPDIFHEQYFKESLFIIQIFNSIIIATMAIILIINATSFDALFVSHMPRFLICLAKVIALIIIILALILFEISVLFIVPTIKFSYYKPDIRDLIIFIYLFLTTILELVISILVTSIINQVISPMLFMFVSILIRLFSNNVTSFKENISNIIPIISISNNNFVCEASFITIIWFSLILFIYIAIYSIKDLKIN